jgi:hypothetical protein
MKPPATGIRASDAEREQIASLLQTAAGDGRLTPEEAGERLAQSSTARFRDELALLVRDLPDVVREDPNPLPPRRAAWFLGGVIRAIVFASLVLLAWRFAFWPMWLLGVFGFVALARVFRFGRGARRRVWVRWHGPGSITVVR